MGTNFSSLKQSQSSKPSIVFEHNFSLNTSIATSLSPECLQIIFEYLEKESFYSCLLVNRSWSKVLIRVLIESQNNIFIIMGLYYRTIFYLHLH
ncbi:hypothetical protein GLOIN_2v1568886 [Rhizophagus irregularis DAOM 181602=DAOM 197198]|uniref:F-box domain-containing protein n=1 Tax=Rhizophagus irregularis (strain DAOM 181602 / DAOM 197198 / MUCL 43194) TaxID=747089 RepID=A0A2P4QBX3_RHIID|nr:hypothetical protein GLOIN_2v1568886 [Rhizophagus irregularis DAOM 181602=DAOM 197198]POG75135.1 hypothetical protein GLOIN_2v1568886 [Rhizophagus irregularis DAOM 181602=DAOM 197198]|eukprot:XP_025182001.1 hypothetical protein GLOIN_2v1568886 [Rhizophagus irregularis DAOM 181602=DAOM 197198]